MGCPRRHFWRYELGLKTDAESHALRFGSAWHAAMEGRWQGLPLDGALEMALKGMAFEEIDVMLRPGRRKEMTERSGGRTSVPQVFVDGRHIGNCDEIYDLEDTGRLDALLNGGADA